MPKCMTRTKLLKFDRDKLQKVLEKDPAHSLILFKHLAAILGNRLLQSYKIISSILPSETSPAYGTGQILAIPETEPA